MAYTLFSHGLYTIQPWPVHHSAKAYTPFSHGLYTIQPRPIHHSAMAYTPFSHGLYTIQPWPIHHSAMACTPFSHGLYTIQPWPVHRSATAHSSPQQEQRCVAASAKKKTDQRSSPSTTGLTHLGLFAEAQVDEAGAQSGQQLRLIHPRNRNDSVTASAKKNTHTQI